MLNLLKNIYRATLVHGIMAQIKSSRTYFFLKGNPGCRLIVKLVFCFCMVFPCFHQADAQGDITFEKQVTGENVLSSYTNQLVMLEFWATWCGPCIAAFSHTEYLQETFRDELKVIAMTNEPLATVTRFLERHPLNSTILIDADGINHDRYAVTQIPYAVLLDQEAQILWTGHPADLKEEALKAFIQQKRVQPAGTNLLAFRQHEIKEHSPEPPPLKYLSIKGLKRYNNIAYRELPQRSPLSVKYQKGFTQVTGSMEELIAYLLGPQKYLIESTWKGVPAVEIRIPLIEKPRKKKQAHDKIREYFLEAYQISLNIKMDTMSGIVLKMVDQEKLWDSNRLRLTEEGESIFLLDEENIEADNMTMNDFSQLLSSILKKPVTIKKPVEGIYDWDLHIKYAELMKEQLREEFGIELQEIRTVGEVLHFHHR